MPDSESQSCGRLGKLLRAAVGGGRNKCRGRGGRGGRRRKCDFAKVGVISADAPLKVCKKVSSGIPKKSRARGALSGQKRFLARARVRRTHQKVWGCVYLCVGTHNNGSALSIVRGASGCPLLLLVSLPEYFELLLTGEIDMFS